jgi:hypothetical protein
MENDALSLISPTIVGGVFYVTLGFPILKIIVARLYQLNPGLKASTVSNDEEYREAVWKKVLIGKEANIFLNLISFMDA